MAYVAQHAFHHLEEHLDTTPLKYMFRRYGQGEDKEEASKVGLGGEEEHLSFPHSGIYVYCSSCTKSLNTTPC